MLRAASASSCLPRMGAPTHRMCCSCSEAPVGWPPRSRRASSQECIAWGSGSTVQSTYGQTSHTSRFASDIAERLPYGPARAMNHFDRCGSCLPARNMEARPAYGRIQRSRQPQEGKLSRPDPHILANLDPADRGIGRGHPGDDDLDSLCGEGYGLADPTTLNLITASAHLLHRVLMAFLPRLINRRRIGVGFDSVISSQIAHPAWPRAYR
jgi:hypothetical protein